MNKRKITAIAAALCLIALLAIGGTVAWLVDTSNELTNTFTPSNIDVNIAETKNNFQIIPSVAIEKDPKVTANSNVDYYVFVEVTESDNWLDDMTYEIADGWTLVPGTTNVYYQTVSAGAFGPTSVLKDDQVLVSGDITDEQLAAMTANPTLTFRAYAVQQANGNAVFAPEAAWALRTK